MPEEDPELQETDQEESFELPREERRLITQAYDLSIQTLVQQWKDGILIVPDFQRDYIWDNGKASRLIESVLLSIPIPVLYFNETEDTRYEIIDGHQRINSLVRYTENQFSLTGISVLGQFKGKRFYNLPEREQRFIMTRVIRAIIVSFDSSPGLKFEIFGRLNTGSMTLNPQEIRNALYIGPFNDLLKSLEKNSYFRQCIGTKTPRSRMVDRELALRFFALLDGASTYKPPLLSVLNRYASEHKEASSRDIQRHLYLFETAAMRVATIFGPAAFKLTNDQGLPIDRNVNRALFDAQMLTASWMPESITVAQLADIRPNIIRAVSALSTDDDFLDSIQRATGDRARFRRRLRMYAAAFNEAGIPVDLPQFQD